MPAGTYAAMYEGGGPAEIDAILARVRAGDQDAKDILRGWTDGVRACISEGFCPSCDGPLTPGLCCPGYGPGGGHGHGWMSWDADGNASLMAPFEYERPRPERMEEIPWPSKPPQTG